MFVHMSAEYLSWLAYSIAEADVLTPNAIDMATQLVNATLG